MDELSKTRAMTHEPGEVGREREPHATVVAFDFSLPTALLDKQEKVGRQRRRRCRKHLRESAIDAVVTASYGLLARPRGWLRLTARI